MCRSDLAALIFIVAFFLDESTTTNHWLPWVLRKSLVRLGLFAEQEPRTFAGDDFLGERT
jgi:hypothetical protein